MKIEEARRKRATTTFSEQAPIYGQSCNSQENKPKNPRAMATATVHA